MRSVQRTVARFAVRRSSTSAPSVNRYSEVDPALLPEATFAHALKALTSAVLRILVDFLEWSIASVGRGPIESVLDRHRHRF